jgi:excisionase family DNA binding protein
VKYYTVTEAANKLGIDRKIILRLITAKKIVTIKDKAQTSPHKIPESELEKIKANNFSQKVTPKAEEVEKQQEKTTNAKQSNNYEDFIEIQKTLAETMRNLAMTQEKIASTLAELIKKI